MLSERQLEELLKVFQARTQAVTEEYLTRMGEHLRDIGSLSATDVHRLIQLKRMNANIEAIKREIARIVGVMIEDVEEIFLQVAIDDERFAREIFESDHTPTVKFKPGSGSLSTPVERTLKAQLRITQQAMANLSQTTIDSTLYREAVDKAVQIVQTGMTDYTSAIRSAMKKAAAEGLKVVYPSGYSRRLDTAVRQNVLDGIRALNQDILDQLGKEFKADGVEISAHALCATDHLPYQGRQYSRRDFERIQNTLSRPFGMWNCKHTMYPILMGITEPAHTEEELAQYAENSNAEITIDGVIMSRYEWSQQQRMIETKIRAQKDIAVAAKASGDMTARREAQRNINAWMQQYERISKAAGLDQRPDKMTVAGFRKVKTAEELKPKRLRLKNSTENGILIVTERHEGRYSPQIMSESPNAVIDVVGKKGGISRYIYGADRRVVYRVDNNDHGYPTKHKFKNGEHYHTSNWNDSEFMGYNEPAEIPPTLRELCKDILKGDE